jgi:branched-chain amino acid transport system ATP-binding protein
VFNLVTGVYRPTAGDIRFAGKSLVGLKPWQITRLGIARTFQNIRLFQSLSVFDNVRVAYHLHLKHHSISSLIRLPAFHEEERQVAARTTELLEIFDLARVRDEPAKSLPYGNQRRLEIVRALATQPRLLLLDEPAAGMNPTEKTELTRLIREVQARHGRGHEDVREHCRDRPRLEDRRWHSRPGARRSQGDRSLSWRGSAQRGCRLTC